MYLDANNLYGCAMSMKLTTHGFKWLTGGEMEKLFNNRVVQVWEKTPCILEVDLEFFQNRCTINIMIIHFARKG